MYPNSSDTPSARGQELVPFKPQDDVLEGVIVDGQIPRFTPGGRSRPARGYYYEPLDMDAFARGMQSFAVKLAEGFEAMTVGLVKFAEAAREAGLVPEEPPTDPRARALWMKQHRNHGPEQPKNWRKR
ncbi:hypothetical protein [Pseudarthrobacter polychromogenes]|uniref:Centromere-binding protein ParB C-terminal domain-containing protein n=1 Tax=Pseudarthrobacter polychromogenes TaxID=1676 RepID=A0ABQ1Y2F6_9MICC|nr:hypothetical protein [Pseudarthrobacter polychromogenes]GGH10226.1 hypothetical protein GCM10011577_38930 [Pseudarthrobacter polychromogenes]